MINVVIGAQYGDEGKGLLVDYLSDRNTMVVRFNGGAQAGHTVVRPDGRRHEFHHFGAGGFHGAATLLSRFFIVNPILYRKEYESESMRGLGKRVYVDGRCLVTTPLDMLLNQRIETARGIQRHGSCGVGINETVTRSEHNEYRVTFRDITRLRLSDIIAQQIEYAITRADTLGVTLPTVGEIARLFERWTDDVRFFVRTTQETDDAWLISDSRQVVFEGAQGLRLDEKAIGFPHVTRSRTGFTNVMLLLDEVGVKDEIRVIYVTRTYVTRHGAGPLTDETDAHPWQWSGPETNVTNTYQGALRYGALRCDELAQAITDDYAIVAHAPWQIDAQLAMTCLDQMGESGTLRYAQQAAERVGLPLGLASLGPTREQVVKVYALTK